MSGQGPGWWRWPDGLLWRGALGAGVRLRRERFARFRRWAELRPGLRVLDVGVAGAGGGAVDFFERWYPHPSDLTAVGLGDCPAICTVRGINYVRADGCSLPFADGAFDVAHSNAVVEHVGRRERQRQFVAELCRVARRVWVATPDGASPFEPHTLVPMAHWLPDRWRGRVYRLAGRGHFADPDELNPLDGEALRGLFPREFRRAVRLESQCLLGLPAVVVATLQQ